MNPSRLQLVALALALVGVGVIAWAFQLRPALEVEAEPLLALPHVVAGYRGEDLPLESAVESLLRADANIQRAYVHPLGGLVWLYVGYYGTERGGFPEHTPEECYPSGGWTIVADREVDVAPEVGLRANELVVEQDGERRLVHFWYQSHRRAGLLGPLDHGMDRLLGRLLQGRSDGALVRLSTPLEGDEEAARTRLRIFGRELAALLAQHWPRERPTSSIVLRRVLAARGLLYRQHVRSAGALHPAVLSPPGV